MKIKIIDDDIQFIDSLKNNLTGEFDHVLINGSTSFDDEYDYDIYFLDIDMPNNGLEIARKIKQFNDDIIVIFVSFREDLIFEALQTFPYYFLRKKYLKEELPIVINKIKKNVNDESGMGVIEIVLIILVLVGLALVFKEQISGVANGVYESINEQIENF